MLWVVLLDGFVFIVWCLWGFLLDVICGWVGVGFGCVVVGCYYCYGVCLLVWAECDLWGVIMLLGFVWLVGVWVVLLFGLF